MKAIKRFSIILSALALTAGAATQPQIVEKMIGETAITASAVYYSTGASFTRQFSSTANNKRPFAWPISTSASGYNKISSSWEDGRSHGAIDIAVPSGTQINASAAGTVVEAGDFGDGYGIHVTIKHTINGKTLYTKYSHMKSTSVAKGATVTMGQKIGLSGNTGNSGGPHLDYQVMTKQSPSGGADRMATNIDPLKIVRQPATLIVAATEGSGAGNSTGCGIYLKDVTTKDYYATGTVIPKAPNTSDTTISQTLTTSGTYYNGPIREKNNDSSVYVKLNTACTASQYRFRVYGLDGNSWTSKNSNLTLNSSCNSVNYVTLKKGQTYLIYNTVNEKGKPYAGLQMCQTAGSKKTVNGVWSPDSIGKYTVAN